MEMKAFPFNNGSIRITKWYLLKRALWQRNFNQFVSGFSLSYGAVLYRKSEGLRESIVTGRNFEIVQNLFFMRFSSYVNGCLQCDH